MHNVYLVNADYRAGTGVVQIGEHKVHFDDIVEQHKDADYDTVAWSYVCEHHVATYGIPDCLLDGGACDGVLCGVEGCKNEADFYFDIPCKED